MAPATQWRRVHKITPLLNAWKAVVAVLAFVAWQATDQLTGLPAGVWDTVTEYRTTALLIAAGVVVVVALLAVLYSTLAWRRMRFALGSESVDLHTGILFRQERHARLNRVQAVDVVQPLLGRLFGLAQVRVETAGGDGSNVIIGYLAEAEAQDLRNEIMARAAGLDIPERAPGVDEPVRIAAAPEREMLEVLSGRLIPSLLRSGSMLLFPVVLVGIVVLIVVTGTIAPVFGLLPALLGWGGYLWGRFAGEFGFKVAVSADGIRLRHGLLETRTQTLPPGRVQAVSLKQPLLWRGKGWWRVEVNVAGYGLSSELSGSSAVETVLLPVGERGDALTALWLVVPDLGVPNPRELLDAALEGEGEAAGFLGTPHRARAVDPLAWRRQGVRITETALLIRSGRLNRRLVVVPHGHTQSLALSQGPLERRLRLTDLVAHSVPGPVVPVAAHLDEQVGRELLIHQADRARRARAKEAPAEWLRRVGAE
ncbi:PH domain-containing protein [Georgenia sp.]